MPVTLFEYLVLITTGLNDFFLSVFFLVYSWLKRYMKHEDRVSEQRELKILSTGT